MYCLYSVVYYKAHWHFALFLIVIHKSYSFHLFYHRAILVWCCTQWTSSITPLNTWKTLFLFITSLFYRFISSISQNSSYRITLYMYTVHAIFWNLAKYFIFLGWIFADVSETSKLFDWPSFISCKRDHCLVVAIFARRWAKRSKHTRYTKLW